MDPAERVGALTVAIKGQSQNAEMRRLSSSLTLLRTLREGVTTCPVLHISHIVALHLPFALSHT